MRPRPSFGARLFAAIAGIVLLALAALPTIGLASLFTVHLGAGASDSPTASASATFRPSPSASPSPSGLVAEPDVSPSPSGDIASEASPSPTPSPPPAPVGARSMNLGGKATFVSQATVKWCASAAIQNVVNLIVTNPDKSADYQRSIEEAAAGYTTRADLRNGGWGPRGMADALTTLTGVTYKLRALDSRSAALQQAVIAMAQTHRPVVLLAWRGAHAWVMTGYKVDRDPLAGRSFTVKGAYILDPWYPRVSNIWGRSLTPGAWHDTADLARNFLPWRRPEARYPGRDGRFLLLVPVKGA